MKLILKEADLEKNILHFLKNNGFSYKENVFNLRNCDNSQVFLLEIFEKAIKRFNKNIDENLVNQVIFQIEILFRNVATNNKDSLVEINKKAHHFLVNGVKVKNPFSRKMETIKIIDFDNWKNNDFLCTNQFKVISEHPDYEKQIPDIVIYLNGLPIIIIELKNPEDESDYIIPKAYEQIQNYQKYLPKLFVFNIFNVISNKNVNKYGVITSNYERYFFWKNKLNQNTLSKDPSEQFINSLLKPKTILDILKNYVYFTDEKETKKIIASYHQYFGVKKALGIVSDSIYNNLHDKSKTGKGKRGGIFWHTQGSGKSCSMIMLSKNLATIHKKLTTIVITDRNNLDNQLFENFQNAKTYLSQSVKQIDSIKHLKKEISSCQQNGVYFSTIQKFVPEVGFLSDRDDILVISDEAHRSHCDVDFENFKVDKEKQQIMLTSPFARNLRLFLNNATFVGFTATPIHEEDRSTVDIFGDYISQYRLDEALNDGFVVDINYESRKHCLKLDPRYLKKIDLEYEKISEQLEKNVELTEEIEKKLRQSLLKMEHLIGDKDRIHSVSEDLSRHYLKRINVLKGKALFVVFNREIALKYYNQIIELGLIPKQDIAVVVSVNQQSDNSQMKQLWGDQIKQQEIIEDFQNDNTKNKILIVVHKLLTGFDCPTLDTMYIDRPIKDHNLMQAIARVNRVYSDKNDPDIKKENGLIVDYIGIWPKLKKAFTKYLLDKSKFNQKDIEFIKQKLLKLGSEIKKEFLSNLVFDTNKIGKDSYYCFNLMEQAQDLLHRDKKVKDFARKAKYLKKFFASVLSILSFTEKNFIHFLIILRNQLVQREIGNLDAWDADRSKMEQLIEKSIEHNNVTVIKDIRGTNISLDKVISFLSRSSQENTNNNLQAERSVNLTRRLIKLFTRTNRVRGDKLSKRLESLIKQYHDNFNFWNDDNFQSFFAQLKDIAQETQKRTEEDKKLNLNSSQLAFYEIISSDEYSENNYDRQKIRIITLDVFNKVKNILTKAWHFNQKQRKLVEAEIYESLLFHKYPPKTCKILRESLVNQLKDHIDDNLIVLSDVKFQKN